MSEKVRKSENRFFFKMISVRLVPLLKMPVFWTVTLLGNGFIACGATTLHYFERELQTPPLSRLDSLSWAIGLVTTVGYGNLTPFTQAGKITVIFLMIGGTLFLWSYMGLLVGVLLAPDISLIERELRGIKRESNLDVQKLDEVLAKLAKIEQQTNKKAGE